MPLVNARKTSISGNARLHCTLYSTDGMLPGVCIACPKADHQNRFLDSRHFTICQRRGIRQISALSLFLEQFQRLWLGQHPEQLHPVKIVRYGLFPRPPQNAQAGTDLTVRCQFRFQFPADCTGKRRRITLSCHRDRHIPVAAVCRDGKIRCAVRTDGCRGDKLSCRLGIPDDACIFRTVIRCRKHQELLFQQLRCIGLFQISQTCRFPARRHFLRCSDSHFCAGIQQTPDTALRHLSCPENNTLFPL